MSNLANAEQNRSLLPNDFEGVVDKHNRAVQVGVPPALEFLLGPGSDMCSSSGRDGGSGKCSSGVCRTRCCLTGLAESTDSNVCSECNTSGRCADSSPSGINSIQGVSTTTAILGSLGAVAGVAAAAACCLSKSVKVGESGVHQKHRNKSKFTTTHATNFTSDSRRSKIPSRQWNGRTRFNPAVQSRTPEFDRIMPATRAEREAAAALARDWAQGYK
jgi:hypothetical protein